MCRRSCRRRLRSMFASSMKTGRFLPSLPGLLASLALTILGGPASAQAPAASAPVATERAALVIGNEAYPGAPAEAAVGGARELASVLRQGGFKVFYLENARRSEILQALS